MREICNAEGYRTLEVPDGVGGRFSVLSAVGLFSAAMCGIDIDALMAGAAAMDKRLKDPDVLKNPAALIAAIHYAARPQGQAHERDDAVLHVRSITWATGSASSGPNAWASRTA